MQTASVLSFVWKVQILAQKLFYWIWIDLCIYPGKEHSDRGKCANVLK